MLVPRSRAESALGLTPSRQRGYSVPIAVNLGVGSASF